jgi:hypothetical protein
LRLAAVACQIQAADEVASGLVGETRHYLNSQIELEGRVLDLIRTYCDRYATVGLGKLHAVTGHSQTRGTSPRADES